MLYYTAAAHIKVYNNNITRKMIIIMRGEPSLVSSALYCTAALISKLHVIMNNTLIIVPECMTLSSVLWHDST